MKEHLNISWKFLLALIVIFVSGKVVGYAIAVHRDTSVSAPPASPPALEPNMGMPSGNLRQRTSGDTMTIYWGRKQS